MVRRLFIDVLTVARASGHADGIVRTLREFSRYAQEKRTDATFVMHDPETNSARLISAEWIEPILRGDAKVDTSHFPDPDSPRSHMRARLPRPLRWIAMWIGRPRRRAFLLLERIRLRGHAGAAVAEKLQMHLINEKYRRELATRHGGRRSLIPYDMAAGEPVKLGSGDILVLAGSDWTSMRQQIEAAGKLQDRPRIAVLCYDIIPLLYPQFFLPSNARSFRACFETAFAQAGLIVFNAGKIESDARRYCEQHRIEMRPSAIVRLGADFDPVRLQTSATLPDGLHPDRYALFVSTIEPRKGHAMLHRVWKRLLTAGLPQRYNFKLVFLGRQGWLVDDLMAELKGDPDVGNNLIMLSNVDDAMLGQLYSNAAFCVYPSLYEGFGLPIIEAFRFGKAVVTSDGGALPEAVGIFSPIVPARDEDAWFDILAEWIADSAPRQHYENLIKERFEPRSWDEAAREFYELIDRNLQ